MKYYIIKYRKKGSENSIFYNVSECSADMLTEVLSAILKDNIIIDILYEIY